MSAPVYVVASAAVSPFGLGGDALVRGLRGEVPPVASTVDELPAVPARAVAPVAAAVDPVPAKARKTMARGAYLAAVALRALVTAAAWVERDAIGYFLGVGASGGSMHDLEAILAATLAGAAAGDDGALDLQRFGSAGIPACNPLLAFQLMNNFTMCHGAILEGTTGPSGAFFSRGAGTVTALVEAREAIIAGDCARAIAGGADSALHPVTWLEHARLADVPVRLPASEGAALLALAAAPVDGAPAIVVEVAAQVTRADDPAARAAALVGDACDVVLVGADDPAQQDMLARPFDRGKPITPLPPSGAARGDAESTGRDAARARSATVVTLDALGTALAATPALGWVAAIELLRAGARRVAVVTFDGAGDLAVAVFARAGGGA